MSALFWTLACVCLALAQHPFVTYPLSLLVLKRIRPRKISRWSTAKIEPLRFALCMCAYNEEGVIERKIANLLELKAREPGLSVHIYVDGASDRTAELLSQYADRFDLVVSSSRHGKTHGMNLLSARANADILVFTDANVMLDLECIARLRDHFANPTIGCVCGNLVYVNGGESVTAASGSLYWRFEEWTKRLEGEVGSVMGADGSLFALRRSLRVDPPEHIIDDMYVSFLVLCQGFRVVQVDDARAYEESVTAGKEEFGRKVRIACQAFNVHRLIWPRIRKLGGLTVYQYLSHKYLRWLSIYFLAGAALSIEAACITQGLYGVAASLAVVAVATFAVGSMTTLKPFAQLVDVLLALAGAGWGVLRSLRGERFQTWTPAASIRRASTGP